MHERFHVTILFSIFPKRVLSVCLILYMYEILKQKSKNDRQLYICPSKLQICSLNVRFPLAGLAHGTIEDLDAQHPHGIPSRPKNAKV